MEESINKVVKLSPGAVLEKNTLIIDTRPVDVFKKGHSQGAINLQNSTKFETWLGSVVGPDELFYLIAENEDELDEVISKTAKIGYESNIKGTLLSPVNANETSPEFDLLNFKNKPKRYTIVDARNWSEINDGLLFNDALTIPLPELRERLDEIPTDKPIVVHCAAGYRSAAAASIIAGKIKEVPVYDLSEEVAEFESVKGKNQHSINA
jgi:rhodanese-related sulfurtransferase